MSVDPEGSQLPEDGLTRLDFAAYIRTLARVEVERLQEPAPFPGGHAYIRGRVSALLGLAERVQAGQIDPEEDHPALPMIPRDFSEYIHHDGE